MNKFTIMGFESIGDFVNTLFGLSSLKINFIVVCFTVLTTFITGFVYDNHVAVYLLWTLYAVDFITGIAAAVYTKTLASSRLPRVLVNMVTMTLLLAISWWMSQVSFIFMILPALVIGGAYSTLFVSLVENLSRLEVLPKGIQKIIKKRFGLATLEKKLFDE